MNLQSWPNKSCFPPVATANATVVYMDASTGDRYFIADSPPVYKPLPIVPPTPERLGI
jgi:hypothetical protein